MTNVFDTLVNRAFVPGPPAGIPIVTINGLMGAVYSIFVEMAVFNSTAASPLNMILSDGTPGTDIAQAASLVGIVGDPLQGTIVIPRWTLSSGVFEVRANNADVLANYFAQISISPLRGAFQS